MNDIMIESVGILGTIFIIVSFLFNDTKKIRFTNSIGSIIFIVYGILIGSISTWLLNIIVIVIQLVKLIKSKKKLK